jgi:demethylmenaquinone methyltransferase/2-methoxy-6-polyprenyl-1,4-benzoquinol methylase
MTSIPERYDRNAEDYGQYWAPVLDAAARRLLDRIDDHVQRLGRPATILDVGTGHGVLASEARRRWPSATVIGADASSGMLAVARQQHGEEVDAETEPALRWLHAPADALTLPDRSVDAVVSSFVYQLVPDRARALTEALRVLRPGGRIALVTWLDRGRDFEPSIEFDEAMYDLDIDDPEDEEEEEVRAGDFRSPRSAARELREAGFKRVSAEAELLEYRWSRDSYLEFKERYEERTLFGWLDEERAVRLLERARERLQELPASAFEWEAELVSATGQRPG